MYCLWSSPGLFLRIVCGLLWCFMGLGVPWIFVGGLVVRSLLDLFVQSVQTTFGALPRGKGHCLSLDEVVVTNQWDCALSWRSGSKRCHRILCFLFGELLGCDPGRRRMPS